MNALVIKTSVYKQMNDKQTKGSQRVRLLHIKLFLYRFLKATSKYLPVSVQRFIASSGYPRLVFRNNINYVGNVFGSPYTIEANSSNFIEVSGTCKNFCEEAFEAIRQLDLHSAIVFDIGANVGVYSIGMANLGAKKVYAIEPGPYFSKLKKNIESNHLDNIVSCHNIGFGKEESTLLWFGDFANPGNGHVLDSRTSLITEKIPTQLFQDGVKVEITTFDKFIDKNQISMIDLIKIDVEGMEWDILSHAKSAIEKYKPILVVETHRVASDMLGYDCITPIFTYLYSCGYKSYSHMNNTHYSQVHDLLLKEFIYPNFTLDTVFIHPDSARFKLPTKTS